MLREGIVRPGRYQGVGPPGEGIKVEWADGSGDGNVGKRRGVAAGQVRRAIVAQLSFQALCSSLSSQSSKLGFGSTELSMSSPVLCGP